MMKKVIKKIYLMSVYGLFRMLPVKKRRVIFSSYYGRQYSGDPKALYESLINSGRVYDIIWVLNHNVSTKIKLKSKIVSRYSIRHLYYLATSEYRIDNCQESHWLKPSIQTKYIQTWHGTPIKKIAQDVPGNHMQELKFDWLLDSKSWTYLLSPSDFVANNLKQAFGIKSKNIISIGSPRNDILLEKNEIKKNEIKEKIGVLYNKKIILYAPTFRNNVNDMKSFNVLSEVANNLPEDYIILIRAHSNVKCTFTHINTENFIDVTSYNDVQEILLISDVLVTDYSSIFFDFAILERPMIFFSFDLIEYQEQSRGFYVDYSSFVPGCIVTDKEGLVDSIINYTGDEIDYKEFNYYYNNNNICSKDVLNKIGLLDDF